MNIDFIGSVVVSVINVIKTMASVEVTRGKSLKKRGDVAYGDVTGVIGMIAPNAKGSIAISFNKNAALEIMSGMLGETITQLDKETSDCVGEITNMVAGGAKKIMSEKGLDFGMATPVVITGKNHLIMHQVDNVNLAIPFKTKTGAFILEISFKANK